MPNRQTVSAWEDLLALHARDRARLRDLLSPVPARADDATDPPPSEVTPMPSYLSRGDRAFLASVTSDQDHKLADLIALAEDVDALAAAEDLDVELPALDALADDEDLADDSERIDAARSELRGVIGYIQRGEHLPEDTSDV